MILRIMLRAIRIKINVSFIILFSFLGLIVNLVDAQVVVADFEIDNQICETVEFLNKSTASGGLSITGYSWDFGDATFSTDENPTHTYTGAPGVYNVKLTVFHDGPGQETVAKDVFYLIPNASFDATTVCFGEVTDFTSTSTSPIGSILTNWEWDLDNDGSFEVTGESITHTFVDAGTKTVGLKVTNDLMCENIVYLEVQVLELPIADFTADPVCLGATTLFANNSTAGVGTIIEYRWDFNGDGIFDSFEEEPSLIFPIAGIFDVKLEVENSSNCIASVVNQVEVWDNPQASYTYDPACPFEEIQFTDESVDGSSAIVNWEWDFNDGSPIDNTQNPTHKYIINGSFDVSLTVTDENSCLDISMQTIIQQKPDAGFQVDDVCFGQPSLFDDTSTYETGYEIILWQWNFGDTFTSNEEDPEHTYLDHGLYEVELIVENQLMCSDTAYKTILVDTLPVAGFTFDPACQGLPTCFYDTSIANADTLIAWEWNFGDGGNSSLKNPCHIYINEGTYDISLKVTNSDGCESEIYIESIVVSKVPDVDFNYSEVCFGDTTFFINLSDTFSYQLAFLEWDFDDPESVNNTSNEYEPKHLFSVPGFFNVKLLIENEYGCIDSIIKNVIVDSIPEANFSMPDTIGVNVQFFIADSSLAHGSPILTKFWNFGDGQNATNINPVFHTYDTPGKYEVCLTVDDFNGCSQTFCDSIVVVGEPEANFNYASDITLETYFYDESLPANSIIDWFWDFGDPTTLNDTISGVPNPMWQYPAEGWYYVYLQVFDKFGGTHNISKQIYAGNAVVAAFNHSGQCLDDTTIFVDNSSSPISAEFDTWYWDFGDGEFITYFEHKDTVKHHYAGPGNYQVKFGLSATVNGFFMTDTVEQEVSIYEYPTALIDTNYLGACFGSKIFFQDATIASVDPIVEWLWDFGTETGDQSILQNPSYLYADTGNFYVTMKILSETGCYSTDTAIAHVNFTPDFGFIYENNCLNSPTQFIPDYDSSKVQITAWHWDFGDPLDPINTSTSSHPTHVYDYISLYEVTMKMESYNCPGEYTEIILVYPIPYSQYETQPDFEGVQGRTKFTNNSIYSSSFLWDFGNGNTSSVADPIEVYEQDSLYTITLVSYNEYGCSDTSRSELNVFFRGLYFPTAFSPNNPNSDISYFTPKGVNLKTFLIQVFDQRGSLMWESTKLDSDGSPVESWDGYYDGRLMPQDMYFWKAEGVFKDGSVWQGQSFDKNTPRTTGTVTLVR